MKNQSKLTKAGEEALSLAKQLKQAADYGAPGMLDQLNTQVEKIAKASGFTVKEIESEAQRLSKRS